VKKIGKTQQAILDFIETKIKSDGYAPSVREIAAAVGLRSPSTVHAHLNALERKGILVKQENKMRTLRLTDRADSGNIMVPLVGRVTAGAPILAVEEIEDYIPFDGRTLRGKELFALRVTGDSMIDAGILDGDTIVVEKTATCSNGDIVVALLEDDEATVKRFYREKGYFRLQPENADYSPILVTDLLILGKVVASFRFY
jgi:repressor LexA